MSSLNGNRQVISSVADNVLTLTLNRPEKLNAVTYQMISELLAELQRAEEDPGIRCILLVGSGRAFSAGDDVTSMGEMPYGVFPGAHPVEEYQQRLIRRLFMFPKPVVAAIRGRCHGIAQDITLSADFRLVSKSTVYGDMRAKRAVPVGSGGTYLLALMIGLPAATTIMMTGEVIDAEEMARLNLATCVVEDDALETEAVAFARRLASGPTKALSLLKRELRSRFADQLDSALGLEISLLDEPVEDRTEGRQSFAERREPVYSGR
ncbi:MAG: enoyl-CoA hydratase/isomerase family protein [Dehalococcoidia bacterium]|nr:enoyl-CoA hydratase/isomerase family protein [Dehalococcoidia bacterium]